MLSEESIQRYDAMNEDQLRDALRQYNSKSEHWGYIQMVLREHAEAASRSEIAALRHDVSDIRDRLRSSEWRTFTLWFALFGVIIAGLSLIRDYMNLQRLDSAPSHFAPATQSTATSQSDLSALPPSDTPVLTPVPASTSATVSTSEPDSK
jgi:hypothetical protein